MNVLLTKKSWYVKAFDLYPAPESGSKLEDAVVWYVMIVSS